MTATDTAAPVLLWERQPNESAPAFDAFARYRDMGASGRSLAAVAREVGKSKPLMDRWSREHSWVLRVDAYDKDEDRRRQVALRQARLDALTRHATIAANIQGKVARRLSKMTETEVDSMAVGDLVRMLDVSTRIERQALGLPDRVVAEPDRPDGVAIGDVGSLSPEERRARLTLLMREAERRVKGDAE